VSLLLLVPILSVSLYLVGVVVLGWLIARSPESRESLWLAVFWPAFAVGLLAALPIVSLLILLQTVYIYASEQRARERNR